MMTFQFFLKSSKIFQRNIDLFASTMVGKGQRKFTVLVALESPIWGYLMLFQHQTQQHDITMFDLI